ncbi:hypothetical protein H072_8705 [Dactylellina haptotyla CBS 200.50]|uniref:Uncharacterized protein n=1 Tax=Dactylellina haptotyla (strain CBS 200.50) TaxID=1284197 RepID=S8BQR2_DACHA|nr:hypothetical protein H072_8705 [Dactylellina haptotyla CBS 200.50]
MVTHYKPQHLDKKRRHTFGPEKDIVELLLAAGADVNAQGGEYGNALQAAAFGQEKDIVELLLAAGADVNAQGGKYGNALQAAASVARESFGSSDIIFGTLLAAGADINAEGPNGSVLAKVIMNGKRNGFRSL